MIINSAVIESKEMPQLADPIINIALACWCVVNLKVHTKIRWDGQSATAKGLKDMEPIDKFAFAQFLLFVASFINLIVAFFFYAIEGQVGMMFFMVIFYIYFASYELYYSYCAWSLVYHVVNHTYNPDASEEAATPMV